MTTLIDDNGQEIQIEDVPLTKQSVSFFDTKIKGDFSLNFNIPFTSENKKKLNYYTPHQVGTVLDQTWTITRNGNRLSRGQLVLQGIKDEEFELFFIAGNAEWISGLIKETADFDYISQLDDELTGQWNLTEIDNSLTRTRGFIWPLVDWSYKGNRAGSNWHSTEIYATTLQSFYTDYHPCVYLHTFVKKIFRQSGFLVDGSLFSNKDFNSIIIAPGSQLTATKKFIDERSVRAEASAAMTFPTTLTDYIIPFDLLINGRPEIYSVVNYEYQADTNMTVNVNVSGTFNASSLSGCNIYAYLNGVSNTIIGQGGSSSTAALINNGAKINLQRGDKLTFYAESNSTTATITNFQIEILPVKNPTVGDWVRVSDWVKLKAIDVIKFVFTYFGCVSNYDNQSKTITINVLDTIKDDEDWSEFIQSYGVEIQKTQSQNNIFKWKKSKEFEQYDDITGGFGGGNLTTGIKQDNFDWYESPFAPAQQVLTGRGLLRGPYLLPRIDLIELSDNGGKNFTSKTSHLGLARLQGTGFDFIVGEVVRVTDYSTFSFYGVIKTAASTHVDLHSVTDDDFPASSGGIIKQSFSYNNTPPRLMYVAPDMTISNCSPTSSYIQVDNFVETSESLFAFAWFMKPDVSEPVDALNQSLAIENTLNGLSHKDTYLKKVNKILGNPLIIAEMLLPESVFFKYNFDSFVYIKFKELSGRFLVKSIEEYKDARTVCRVELFQID